MEQDCKRFVPGTDEPCNKVGCVVAAEAASDRGWDWECTRLQCLWALFDGKLGGKEVVVEYDGMRIDWDHVLLTNRLHSYNKKNRSRD